MVSADRKILRGKNDTRTFRVTWCWESFKNNRWNGLSFKTIDSLLFPCVSVLFVADSASVSVFSYRLNIFLTGMNPFYFHAVNVILHCLVTLVLMYTCDKAVFRNRGLAFATALLFAVHPIHTEAVSIIWPPWNRKLRKKKKLNWSFPPFQNHVNSELHWSVYLYI